MVPKHTSFHRTRPRLGKPLSQRGLTTAARQGCSQLGCLPASGRQCAPHASTLVRWKRGYLSSAKDGLVEILPRVWARRFSCSRAAWAYMGSEGVPIGLQIRATMVVEMVRVSAAADGRGEQ